ncbi:MAG: histidine phosphatase family protein [Bacilli bacterium]|nr:histidine phosphatase family protein [Bacilli bacterium]
MDLYIVRHGETGYNKMGLLHGRTDIPLNQNGIEQANKTKKELENITFDVVISSPLIRAIQTAKIIVPNRKIKIDNRLIERNLGEYEGKPSRIYDFEFYDNLLANHTEKGVEGLCDLVVRARNLILELKEIYSDSTVLLVTHGGFINAFSYCFKSKQIDGNPEPIGLKNGEFIKYHL